MKRLLVIAALLPAILMMRYIYKKDSIEKEPAGLLVRLVFFGAVAIIPACLFELAGEKVLYSLLTPKNPAAAVIENFFIVALAEESCKRFVVKRITWEHHAFNYRFDGVVYGVCTSLGFAALENILYVWDGGIGVALSRAFLAVPLHAFCGVYMGLYLGHAKACEYNSNLHGKDRNLRKSLWIPVLIHGFYDYCLSVDYPVLFVVFCIFVAWLYHFSLQKINEAAATDCELSADWNSPFHFLEDSIHHRGKKNEL